MIVDSSVLVAILRGESEAPALMEALVDCREPLRLSAANHLEAGIVIDRNGSVSDRLSAIGPLMRGIHWESNGAIECLDQAIGVAERLAR